MTDIALEYNYADNTKWSTYFESLTFGSGTATEEQLIKLKRKWYKKNIDSHYELPTSTSTQNTPEGPSETIPPPPKSQAKPTPPQAKADGKPRWEALKKFSLKRMPTMLNVGLNMFGLFMLLLYVASLGTSSGSYKVGLMSIMVGYMLSIYSTHGLPKFSKAYAQALTPDPNVHFFMFCTIFVACRPMILSLAPLIVYIIYNTFDCIRGLAGILYPGRAKSSRLGQILDNKRPMMIKWMNKVEVYGMALLAFGVIRGQASVFVPYVYFQFLQMRYNFNPETKAFVHELRGRADGYINRPYVPAMVKKIYSYATGQ